MEAKIIISFKIFTEICKHSKFRWFKGIVICLKTKGQCNFWDCPYNRLTHNDSLYESQQ